MLIADLILPGNVYLDLGISSKLQALQILSDKASVALGFSGNSIFQLLYAREKLGSTGIGGGIAIPHTRVPRIAKPFGLLARLERAIDFESVDEIPVDILFLLLTPDDDSKDRLNALACVARRLRSEEVLQEIRSASDVDHLYTAVASER